VDHLIGGYFYVASHRLQEPPKVLTLHVVFSIDLLELGSSDLEGADFITGELLGHPTLVVGEGAVVPEPELNQAPVVD